MFGLEFELAVVVATACDMVLLLAPRSVPGVSQASAGAGAGNLGTIAVSFESSFETRTSTLPLILIRYPTLIF